MVQYSFALLFVCVLHSIAFQRHQFLPLSTQSGYNSRHFNSYKPLYSLYERQTSTITTAVQQPEIESVKFFIENHGCQMNLADSDIVRSILLTADHELCDSLEEADLILINTCAIRENAESKVWQRLKYFQSIRKKRLKAHQLMLQSNTHTVSQRDGNNKYKKGYPIIGVLGCMAERIKNQILENSDADFIAGPDSYRKLPDLINLVKFKMGERASYFESELLVNQELESEETYADISPVRLEEGNVHAFVSIARGCNNHCAFCVVPYTRGNRRLPSSNPTTNICLQFLQLITSRIYLISSEGKERSRPQTSILREIQQLSDKGVKEIFLLGQNVNSYHDQSEIIFNSSINSIIPSNLLHDSEVSRNQPLDSVPSYVETRSRPVTSVYTVADGFLQKSKSKINIEGLRFEDLLIAVSKINPEMRIRFQSPHPKDFPESVLRVIKSLPNVCKSLHMPAQHGSSTVLERMLRGYTRDAYMKLVTRARDILAEGTSEGIGLGLSSDFISGFCGETEAFTYSYSKREQTYAGVFMKDDVPEAVKSRRLSEVINTFYNSVYDRNERLEVGRFHLVLVEGYGKMSSNGSSPLTGRTDTNKRVLFPDIPVLFATDDMSIKGTSIETASVAHSIALTREFLVDVSESILKSTSSDNLKQLKPLNVEIAEQSASIVPSTNFLSQNDQNQPLDYTYKLQRGDYVVVRILPGGKGHTLKALPLIRTTLRQAHSLELPTLRPS